MICPNCGHEFKDNTGLVVEELEQTCESCPSQWEGKLMDGRHLYIRYRYGTLRVDVNGETIHSINAGGGLDGSMNFADMKTNTRGVLNFDNMKWVDGKYGR